jgi:hypothetical protein
MLRPMLIEPVPHETARAARAAYRKGAPVPAARRTDSTHMLCAVRALNRIEVVGDTLRHALNRLAVLAPEWLHAMTPMAWKDRYAPRAEHDRLPTRPAARAARALTIRNGGWLLLLVIDHAGRSPLLIMHVPEAGAARPSSPVQPTNFIDNPSLHR